MAKLININDAFEKLCEFCNCGDYEECDFRCSEFENISNIPAVDAVEVVHGHWDDRVNPQWKAYDIRHCSVCGWNIPKSKLRQKDSHWNYCPNCGARMDGDSQ